MKVENNFLNIRRPNEEIGRPVAFGDIQLNLTNMEIFNVSNTHSIKLTPSEYQILNLLIHATNNNIQLKNSDLESFLYLDYPEDKDLPLSNNVASFLSRIRLKLSKIGSRVMIPNNHNTKGGGVGISLKYKLE